MSYPEHSTHGRPVLNLRDRDAQDELDTLRKAWRARYLGADYDPHGGVAAVRREAAFYRWCAAGNDPAGFAPWLAAGHSENETTTEGN